MSKVDLISDKKPRPGSKPGGSTAEALRRKFLAAMKAANGSPSKQARIKETYRGYGLAVDDIDWKRLI